MPKAKTRTAGVAHPAMIGLQHVFRTMPADKRADGIRELKRTTGMSKVSMYEHIGNRVNHGFEAKPPSQDELDAQNRLGKLGI